MKDEIKEILDNLKDIDKTNILKNNDAKIILDYIANLQTISDNRMKTLLKIEQYCIDEKEDLINGGEVCEDVLKIIDELKGK